MSSADISIFLLVIFVIWNKVKVAFKYIICGSFDCCWVLKGCFDQSDCNSDVVGKIGYYRLSQNNWFLQVKVWCPNLFWWPHQQNFIMWLKWYCRCIHVTEVREPLWIKILYHDFSFIGVWLTRKKIFDGWTWFNFSNLRLVLGMALKFYSYVAKGFELKFRKFEELIHLFGKPTREKW